MPKRRSSPIPSQSRAQAQLRPRWERAYLQHVLWTANGKQALGKVVLVNGQRRNGYAWSAAGVSGHSFDLRTAKQYVEAAVVYGAKQLSLF